MSRVLRLLILLPALASGAAFGQLAPAPQPLLAGTPGAAVEQASSGVSPGALGGCDVLQPRFSDLPRQIGPALGDAEKDSYGFAVVGHAACAPAAAR